MVMRTFSPSPHTLFCAWLVLSVVLIAVFPKALAAFAAIGALVYLFLTRAQPILWPKPAILFAATLSALMFASYFWAYDPGGVLSRALKTTGIFAGGILLLAACARLPDDVLPKLGTALVAAGCFVCSYMLFESLTDYPFYRTFNPDAPAGDKFWPFFQNKSVGAITLLAPALLAFSSPKWVRSAFVVLLFLFLAITTNQTSQAVILIGLAAFIVPLYRPKLFWIYAVCVAALVIFAPLIAQVLFVNFAELGQKNEWLLHSSASMRLEIWDFVARKVLESPILGFGLEATRAMTFDSKTLYFATNTVMHPHNGALQIWIEFGAVGAILTTIGLLTLLRHIYVLPDKHAQRLYLTGFSMAFFVILVAWGLWQGWLIGLLFLLSALLQLAVRAHLLALRHNQGGK